MRSIRARPGFAIIRIHIGPTFGPRSIGKRARPLLSRDLRSRSSSWASPLPVSITRLT